MWWLVRYEQEGQRMVSYKEYDPAYGHDPEPNPLWVTTEWNSPALKLPPARSIGGDFNRGGFGSHRAGLGVLGTAARGR